MKPDGVTPDPVFQKIFDRKLKLEPGARGQPVKVIQQALADLFTYELGTFGPNEDGVDGVLGTETVEAIKKFKADHDLFAAKIGSVDRGVVAKLDDLLPSGF
jgi:peptidoglycan hydrolase-like protein with peptidoglycan-binding domain